MIRSVSFPSLDRAMYFSFSVMPATLQVAPLQLIPALFAVTEGTPVVSDTVMSTGVREQTGRGYPLRGPGRSI